MSKSAQTLFPVHPIIKNRWSARVFSDRPITQEERDTLLEAASWAPSSMNDQPWLYYYAHKDQPAFERMIQCLLPGNSAWAKDAALVLLSICKTRFGRNNQFNRHAMHDTGAANALLLIQAASMGIYGRQMGGYDDALSRTIFNIPIDTEIACFMALGHMGNPDTIEEPFRARESAPRSRNGLSNFAADIKTIEKTTT